MAANTYTLTERTLLTAEGKAVPVGNPLGVVLLGPAGKTIPHSQAVAYGLAADKAELYPNHLGGGWYELSTGERVKGKKAAAAAEKALHGPPADKALGPKEDK